MNGQQAEAEARVGHNENPRGHRALDGLIGESPQIREVRAQIRRLLEPDRALRRLPPILILGETGTGKGLLARAIHEAGPRASGPFIAVNCAAIPANLLEGELFGFERGAFTDARHAKAGLFQAAHRGTLFLDEIGALPTGLQAKLLTALEERMVRRLGSLRSEAVDLWIVAATSEHLPTAVREGRFRDDLYHRLAAITITLPPLRQRGADILRLADHFLAQSCDEYACSRRQLTLDARAALLAYRWPGNVRELANTMARAVLLTDEPLIGADRLDFMFDAPEPAASELQGPPATFRDRVDDFERSELLAALVVAGWNTSRAARALGIARNTLRYRMAKYGLRPPEPAIALASIGGTSRPVALAADLGRPLRLAMSEPF